MRTFDDIRKDYNAMMIRLNDEKIEMLNALLQRIGMDGTVTDRKTGKAVTITPMYYNDHHVVGDCYLRIAEDDETFINIPTLLGSTEDQIIALLQRDYK